MLKQRLPKWAIRAWENFKGSQCEFKVIPSSHSEARENLSDPFSCFSFFILLVKETWREIFEPITERNERESVKSRITFFTLWKSFHFHSSQVGFLRCDLIGDTWSCRVLHVFPLHQPPADMNHWIPLNVCHRFNNHVSYEVLWLMQRTIALWKKFIIAYHVHTILFKSIIRWTNDNITCSAAILHFKMSIC